MLPASYLATGCLDLQGTLTFSTELVERFAEETIQQLYKRGFRAIVLLSGHGPMDLLHLLKRVGREQEATLPGLRTYGLHWLELAAATHEGMEDMGPGLVDHAGSVETSWMLRDPAGVRPTRTACPPTADAPAPAGVYGVDPRERLGRLRRRRAWRPAPRCWRSAPAASWPARTSTRSPTSSATSTASGPSRCGWPAAPATPATPRC